MPKPPGGKDDLLQSIRASGGSGGGALRKVKDSDKRDRSAAHVPGSSGENGSSGPPAGGAQGGAGGGSLAGALQDALNKRKQKVSGSGMYFF